MPPCRCCDIATDLGLSTFVRVHGSAPSDVGLFACTGTIHLALVQCVRPVTFFSTPRRQKNRDRQGGPIGGAPGRPRAPSASASGIRTSVEGCRKYPPEADLQVGTISSPRRGR